MMPSIVALALLVRLEGNDRMAVLALAARLADELTLALGLGLDGLAVGDLGLARSGLDLELALHAVEDDLEV